MRERLGMEKHHGRGGEEEGEHHTPGGAGKVRQKRLEQLARQAAVGNSLGKQKRDGDEDKIF